MGKAGKDILGRNMNDGQQEYHRVEQSDEWGRVRIRYIPIDRVQVSRRANLATPMIGGDTLDQGCWGPDGKYHTSKASLRASYKPSGNPQGNSYIEVGNEKLPEPKAVAPSDSSIDASIHKAIAKLGGV